MDLFELFAKLTLDTSDYENNLDAAEKQAESFKEKWTKGTDAIKSGLKKIGVGVGTFTALGAGAFKAADGVSKNLDNIDKMSQKLGLSTDAYQEWNYVMQISGTSIDNMSMGLKTLTNKFDDAVNGSDSAIQTFNRLGLSMEDIQGLSREDLFSKVIFAFQGMEDSAERAALANDLLGRSGQELAPLFNTSAEETQELIKQVRDLGGVMSNNAVKQGARFQDSLTSLKTAFQGAASDLFEKLIPAISDFMDRVSNFVAEGGLDRIIETLQNLAPVIITVVTAFAGFKIISGVISLVQGLSTVFGVLNAVMAANPIGIVVLAIAGLVTAFVVLWNKCEGFRNFFINMWEGIKTALGAVVDFFKNAFTSIGNFISETWDGIKEGASKAWEGIKGAFSSVGGWFKEKFADAKEKAVNAWSNVKEKFGNVWTKIKNAFNIKEALTWGKDMMDNFVQGIKDKVNHVVDAVKGVAAKIKGLIGFSEPTDPESPLHNFHTFAPDMMKLFAQGIRDNEHLITDQIKKSFDFGEQTVPVKTSVSGTSTTDDTAITGGGNQFNFYINDVDATPDEIARDARRELQYMLIGGAALG